MLLFLVCWCDCCGCPLLLFVVGCLWSLLIVVVCDFLGLCVVVCWCVLFIYVVCGLLSVVGCSLLFVVRRLPFVVVCCSLFVDFCLVCLV